MREQQMPPKDYFTEDQRDDIKDALKSAIKEWLTEQFAAFGRWSIISLCALGLVAVLWMILIKAGWHPPGTEGAQ